MTLASSRLFALKTGRLLTLECSCGRACPMRWDERLGTLVIDHGGEAVFIMPPDEFAAFEFGETFKLRDTTFMPWIERVHHYERG